MSKPSEMIIFIGIPASGKSTFYRQNFAETHVCVSLDILHTRFQEGKLLGELLSAGKSCVIDNTNVELAERKKYIDAAKSVAKRLEVPVCDCYKKWKVMHENGVDVTELLANKINHPTREMNRLFATSLIETIMTE